MLEEEEEETIIGYEWVDKETECKQGDGGEGRSGEGGKGMLGRHDCVFLTLDLICEGRPERAVETHAAGGWG